MGRQRVARGGTPGGPVGHLAGHPIATRAPPGREPFRPPVTAWGCTPGWRPIRGSKPPGTRPHRIGGRVPGFGGVPGVVGWPGCGCFLGGSFFGCCCCCGGGWM